MNEVVIVCLSWLILIPVTIGVLELIDYIIAKKRGKEVQYVYKSRKLNKTINVDKVGEQRI